MVSLVVIRQDLRIFRINKMNILSILEIFAIL